MPRTIVRHAEDARFDEGLRAFFAYRDLGIREASGGAFGAHVIRAVPGEGAKPQWHTHDLAFQMVYVLRGWVRFEYGTSARWSSAPATVSTSRRGYATARSPTR